MNPSPNSMEDEVWSGSPSQWTGLKTYAVCALLSLAVAPLLVTIPAAVWKWYTIKCTRYELTTQRLRMHAGVLSKTTDDIELYRVKDTRFQQSFFSRMVGIGDILLISGDMTTPNTLLRGIRGAEEVREKIRVLVETRRDQKRVRVAEVE